VARLAESRPELIDTIGNYIPELSVSPT
jgi:hypothetical protein